MTSDEALEVLGYLLGHEKAVDSGEMEDVQNCLNSQEQEALKVILSEFRELKEGAQKPIEVKFMGSIVYLCKSCGSAVDNSIIKAEPARCHCCRTAIDWSEGKE